MLTSYRQLLKLIVVPAALAWATLGNAATHPSDTFVLGVSSNALPTVEQLITASGIPQSQVTVKSGYSAKLAEKGHLDVAVFASPTVADEVIKKTGAQQRITLGTPQLAAYCANCQDNGSLQDALKAGKFSKLVYADPHDAPIGTAAEAVISNLNYPAKGKVKLIKDPKKVMDYSSKANDIIFTTAAALKAKNIDLTNASKVLVFQASDYPNVDLTHEAVLTNQGKNNIIAQKFMAFLASCAANQILNQNGYVNSKKECTSA